MFQVTKSYTERENLITTRKLDACNFYFSAKTVNKLDGRLQVHSGSQHGAWVTHVLKGFTSYKLENTRGDLWNLEAFYKKTNPGAPYFYCFNILLELKGNAREKILRKEISTE